MARIVATRDPHRPIADIRVVAKNFLGRDEPLCDERGEPVNFAPSLFAILDSRESARRIFAAAEAAAERAARVATRLEAL